MHTRLSERTIYLRFFGPYPQIPQRDLRRFTTVDHQDRVALVATLGGELIGVGRYERTEARSVHNLLHARSVAVIGASAGPSKIGHVVFRNLLRGDLAGPVYPVNPRPAPCTGCARTRAWPTSPTSSSWRWWPHRRAPWPQWPTSAWPRGVKGLLVITSGFGEAGPDGESAQRWLVTEARARGMRVVGLQPRPAAAPSTLT